MAASRRIWVTRTQPEAEATAARVRALGWTPVVQPVLSARICADAKIDLTGAEAIAFTSGHAVRAFAALSPMRALPVFAVGEATAALARAAGFADVRTAAGDVRALADILAASEPKPALVLNPTARAPAADLAALFAPLRMKVRKIVVYETVSAGPDVPPDAIDAILVHSPRAAEIIGALIAADQAARLEVFAISAAAAARLSALPFVRVVVAVRPDEASLLALLATRGPAASEGAA